MSDSAFLLDTVVVDMGVSRRLGPVPATPALKPVSIRLFLREDAIPDYVDQKGERGCSQTFQPHLRNIGALAMRRTDGYGASTVARIWTET